MKRIELIIPKSQEEDIIQVLTKIEIGFSLVDDIRGMGKSGLRDGIGLTDAFHNVLFIIIVQNEQLDMVIQKVSSFYKRAGGLIMVSDVEIWNHKTI